MGIEKTAFMAHLIFALSMQTITSVERANNNILQTRQLCSTDTIELTTKASEATPIINHIIRS